MKQILIFIFILCNIALPAFSDNENLEKALDAISRYKKSQSKADREDFQDYISKAANEEDADAMYLYYAFAHRRPYKGMEYSDVELSDSLSYVYLKKSAEKECPEASMELGLLYNRYGLPQYAQIEKNADKAIFFLKKAGKLSNPKAEMTLGWLFVEKNDYDNALNSFKTVSQHGGKDYYWDALAGQAETNYKMGNYKIASELYKKWFARNKSMAVKKSKNDADFYKPKYKDFVFGIESFIQTKDYEALNLIALPSNSPYNYSDFTDIPYNLNSWNRNDKDYVGKMKILDLIESYYLSENIKPNPSRLKSLESLKLFYSLYNEPDAEHMYTRSFYYRGCGDRIKEVECLKKASENGHLNSSLKLGQLYFTGNQEMGLALDKELSCHYMLEVKKHLDRNGISSKSDYLKSNYLLAMLSYTPELSIFNYGDAIKFANNFINYDTGGEPESAKADMYRILAVCYRFGRGVEQNDNLAAEYGEKSAQLGNENEAAVLEWLKKTTDKPEIILDF